MLNELKIINKMLAIPDLTTFVHSIAPFLHLDAKFTNEIEDHERLSSHRTIDTNTRTSQITDTLLEQ